MKSRASISAPTFANNFRHSYLDGGVEKVTYLKLTGWESKPHVWVGRYSDEGICTGAVSPKGLQCENSQIWSPLLRPGGVVKRSLLLRSFCGVDVGAIVQQQLQRINVVVLNGDVKTSSCKIALFHSTRWET